MHEHKDHSHEPANFNKAFAIGIALNIGFILLEVIFGLSKHSLALLADAGHNVSDVLSLALAWGASRLVKTSPTPRRTYGLHGTSILAALFNAIILLVAIGAIAWEAIRRFSHPQATEGHTVMLVAAVGVIVNAVTAFLFMSGRKHDLNIRGAFLHMAADAGVSLGVVGAGLAIQLTGAMWIDPVVSLVIVVVIFGGTWGLLRDSINLALAAVPRDTDAEAVKSLLEGLPNVVEVHDLQIWGVSTTEIALTAHLVMQPAKVDNEFLRKVTDELREHFHIGHPTLQIEANDPSYACPFAPPHKL